MAVKQPFREVLRTEYGCIDKVLVKQPMIEDKNQMLFKTDTGVLPLT